MFESVNPPRASRRSQIITAMASMFAHAAILGLVVALPLLYFSETLPTPPDMLAFVVASAPPPPPPPPPPPAAAQKASPVKPKVAPKPNPVKPVAMAVPVEAPATIAPERPLELAQDFTGGVEGGVVGGIAGGIVGGIAMMPAQLPPPPPAPAPVKPIRVGGEIESPTLLHRVNPEYPQIAINAKIEGVVILEATVDADGAVSHVRVLRSAPLLDSAAIDAVKQWRYSPLQLNGRAQPFILTVTVSFNL
jgi:protein TonB